MACVYPLLKRHVPYFQSVCDCLEKHLYDRIRIGAPLNLKPLKPGVNRGSLREKIVDAVIHDGETGDDTDDESMADTYTDGEEADLDFQSFSGGG